MISSIVLATPPIPSKKKCDPKIDKGCPQKKGPASTYSPDSRGPQAVDQIMRDAAGAKGNLDPVRLRFREAAIGPGQETARSKLNQAEGHAAEGEVSAAATALDTGRTIDPSVVSLELAKFAKEA